MIGQEYCKTGCGELAARWHLCQLCGTLLAGECLGKRQYLNARYARQRISPDSLAHTYICHTCGFHHIGKRIPNQGSFDLARIEIIAALRRNGNGWVLTQIVEEFRVLRRNEWKAHR